MNNKACSTQKKKIDWLLDHQDLWYGITYSISDPDLQHEYRVKMCKLVYDMRKAKLYSPTTSDTDVTISIRRYIHKARKVRRNN